MTEYTVNGNANNLYSLNQQKCFKHLNNYNIFIKMLSDIYFSRIFLLPDQLIVEVRMS